MKCNGVGYLVVFTSEDENFAGLRECHNNLTRFLRLLRCPSFLILGDNLYIILDYRSRFGLVLSGLFGLGSYLCTFFSSDFIVVPYPVFVLRKIRTAGAVWSLLHSLTTAPTSHVIWFLTGCGHCLVEDPSEMQHLRNGRSRCSNMNDLTPGGSLTDIPCCASCRTFPWRSSLGQKISEDAANEDCQDTASAFGGHHLLQKLLHNSCSWPSQIGCLVLVASTPT